MTNESEAVLRMAMKWGKAEHLLDELIQSEVFDCHFLSKHNPYFDSEDEELAEKLDDIRRKLLCVYDQLSDIREAIAIDLEEEG